MHHWYVLIRPSDPAPQAAVRKWAADLASTAGLPEVRASSFILAVSELLSLALSAPLAAEQPLRMSGQLEGDTLRLVLTWEGGDLPGARADGSPFAGVAEQQRCLIEESVDHWYVERSGCIGSAVLELRLQKSRPEPPPPSLVLPVMPWFELTRSGARERERAEVLIVEDDDLLRDTLADLLGEAGYAVTEARHGAEALRKLTGGLCPDLILLDLMMPVMDGWQFLQATRSDPAIARAPVVVLSAASREEEPCSDVAAFLPKPCDDRSLLHAVSRWCPPVR